LAQAVMASEKTNQVDILTARQRFLFEGLLFFSFNFLTFVLKLTVKKYRAINKCFFFISVSHD